MQITKNKGFTLIELLVVITILSIISVVAYQNFGGAIDKAVSSKKVSDISTIETSLQNFKIDNKYYPAAGEASASNLWGYTGSTANTSNTIVVTYNGEAISSLVSSLTSGGGAVYSSGGLVQIGAKGTISQSNLGKKYLTKDLYDNELGDIKIETTNNKMIDYGVGRYVYSTYRKSSWGSNKQGADYNIAFTIKKQNSDSYMTKIVGSYDKESCYDNKANCPETLIGTFELTTDNSLIDGTESAISAVQHTGTTSYGLPYAVEDFRE